VIRESDTEPILTLHADTMELAQPVVVAAAPVPAKARPWTWRVLYALIAMLLLVMGGLVGGYAVASTTYSSADVDLQRTQAQQQGYTSGYEAGFDEADATAKTSKQYAYDNGYRKGYSDGLAQGAAQQPVTPQAPAAPAAPGAAG